jgi:hypothetical protein
MDKTGHVVSYLLEAGQAYIAWTWRTAEFDILGVSAQYGCRTKVIEPSGEGIRRMVDDDKPENGSDGAALPNDNAFEALSLDVDDTEAQEAARRLREIVKGEAGAEKASGAGEGGTLAASTNGAEAGKSVSFHVGQDVLEPTARLLDLRRKMGNVRVDIRPSALRFSIRSQTMWCRIDVPYAKGTPRPDATGAFEIDLGTLQRLAKPQRTHWRTEHRTWGLQAPREMPRRYRQRTSPDVMRYTIEPEAGTLTIKWHTTTLKLSVHKAQPLSDLESTDSAHDEGIPVDPRLLRDAVAYAAQSVSSSSIEPNYRQVEVLNGYAQALSFDTAGRFQADRLSDLELRFSRESLADLNLLLGRMGPDTTRLVHHSDMQVFRDELISFAVKRTPQGLPPLDLLFLPEGGEDLIVGRDNLLKALLSSSAIASRDLEGDRSHSAARRTLLTKLRLESADDGVNLVLETEWLPRNRAWVTVPVEWKGESIPAGGRLLGLVDLESTLRLMTVASNEVLCVSVRPKGLQFREDQDGVIKIRYITYRAPDAKRGLSG